MEREDAAGLHNDHSVFCCSENVQNKKQNKPSIVTSLCQAPCLGLRVFSSFRLYNVIFQFSPNWTRIWHCCRVFAKHVQGPRFNASAGGEPNSVLWTGRCSIGKAFTS